MYLCESWDSGVPDRKAPSGLDAIGGGAFLLKYQWTPWPEQMARKQQVASKVPTSSKEFKHAKLGLHHVMRLNTSYLVEERDTYLARADLGDLSDLSPRNPGPEHVSVQLHRIFHEAGLGRPRFVQGRCSSNHLAIFRRSVLSKRQSRKAAWTQCATGAG